MCIQEFASSVECHVKPRVEAQPMFISNRKTLRPVEGATKVPLKCENCNNQVDFELYSAKSGPGLGVPIVLFFTDKYTLAKKSYYLLCSICDDAVQLSRQQAKSLGA